VHVRPPEFYEFISEGLTVDVAAFWGAGFLDGRHQPGTPSWRWPELAGPLLSDADSLLDMGTGEGGVLAGLRPLPALTVACEEWLATVPAGVATLRPLGVRVVVAAGSDDNTAIVRRRPGLPFADGSFDVVLNRHEAFDALDVHRITAPGGRFLTQQVGSDEERSVRALLGLDVQQLNWDLDVACRQLRSAGWHLAGMAEERPPAYFTDVAALVGYMRTTPWCFEDVLCTADTWSTNGPLLEALRDVHDRCREGPVEAVAHRFWVSAQRA